jgi:hypothetical protein
MTTNASPFDRPIPPNAVCAQCGGHHTTLKWYCLTGDGDHPRRFLLCDECAGRIKAKAHAEQRPPTPSPSMSEAELRQETRRQRAFQRLGTDHPICVCCGGLDWRYMELHHLEGKVFGKTLVCVCRNCHRKLSNMQKDHARSAELGECPTNIERIGQFLQGLADLLVMLAEKLWEYGAYLIEQASTPNRKT